MHSIKSKLPNTSTSIFTVMSALAAEHGAINLGQGFPDFLMDEELAALAAKGYKHLRNGTFREFISGKSQAWWEYCQGFCQPGKHASDSPWSWQLDLW